MADRCIRGETDRTGHRLGGYFRAARRGRRLAARRRISALRSSGVMDAQAVRPPAAVTCAARGASRHPGQPVRVNDFETAAAGI
jgi:hypothetical protein